MSSIRPGKLFASDYRIESVLSPVPPNRAYVATEGEGGRRVRIVELPASQSPTWARAAIEHPAIAELLSVLALLGSSFGVFAEVEGEPVSAKLVDGNPLGAIEAVTTALRVTEGLTVLHRAGLVHGSVGPDNVVIEPDGRRVVLTFGPVSRQPPGYRAPDRADAKLAPEDDLWAAGALLFEMLSGAAPPESGISAPEQLEAVGIEEDVLGGILAQALAADPNRRSARIASMRHPLRAWLERSEKLPESVPGSKRYAWSRALLPSSRPPPPRQGSDAPELEFGEGHLSEPPPGGIAAMRLRRSDPPQIEVGEGHLSEPPPAGDAAPPMSGPRAHASAPASSAKSRVGLIVGAAVVLSGAALIVLRPGARHHAARHAAPPAATHPAPRARTPHKTKPAPPPPQAPVAPASAAPAASAAPSESVAVCAARHLPAFSFMKMPDMDWLCKQTDPRSGAQRLHGDIVRAANGQTVSPAMQLWSPLTWYGLAEFAVLRGACCPGAPPLQLPAPSAGCQSLGVTLNGLAEHVATGEDPTQQVQAFSDAVGCELLHRHEKMFWQTARPGGSEPHSFEKLLESAMHPRSAP